MAQKLEIPTTASKEFSIDAVEDIKDEEIVAVAKHLLTQPNVYSPKKVSEYANNGGITIDFKNEGDLIYLVGASKNDIASSEYLYSYRGIKESPPPAFDVLEDMSVHDVVSQLILAKAIQSAQGLSSGGLFIALAACAMASGLGFSIRTFSAFRKDAFLFGEAQSRVVVSVAPEKLGAFEAIIAETDVKSNFIGKVKKGKFVIDAETIIATAEAKDLYENFFKSLKK